MTDHWIATAKGRMFARAWAPGAPGAPAAPAAPAIILLHDSVGCTALWRDFPAQLCARTGRRVIAYDRLGFGQSEPHPGPLPLDFIYTECRTALPPLLAALGIAEFVLFGHSVGGEMSVAGAADFGPRCTGLISEAAQIFREDRIYEGIAKARPNLVPGRPQYERLKTYHGEKTDWVLSAWFDTWLDPAFTLDLTSQMARVRCPVLALHGDEDEFASPAQAEFLCAHVAGPSRVHLMKGCGHVPHRARPDEILDVVGRFLA